MHQAALLRGRSGRKLALAVLTEGGPGFGYGQQTIRGVTTRLLRGIRRFAPFRPGKGGKKDGRSSGAGYPAKR